MPYSKKKVYRKNCYKVINKKTKKVFAKCSSKENADKQLRLLRALKYNKDFVPLMGKNKTSKRKSLKMKKS